ncbi:MAG: alpha/beta hydrolase [Candidatus Tectomicrobia bacterium]|nr:alpha/beta hydrolase [Candidatus Tectomicrobia bacterium]
MKRVTRQRDGQQWIYDYILKTTGRPVHHEMDGRQVPAQAKSIRMVSKHLARGAENAERLARAAEARGDRHTARLLYRAASERFREAQHFTIPIICPRRWELLARSRECAARLHALANYPIERVEIPFEGKSIPALLHLLPDRRRAPVVIFYPGMDNTKENYPNPLDNEFIARGIHVLTIDGPGQGEALERGIFVTPENHAAVAKRAVDLLLTRPEADGRKIAVTGRSFGTFWSLRAAAEDPRIAAVAGAVACYYWDRLTIFDEAPIRFKQVFMAMAGMDDEATFDRMCEGYTLKGHAERVRCPVLMATGEFDPLNPLEDAEAVFEALAGPKEMWVFEDEFHPINHLEALAGVWTFQYVADWLQRAFDGKIPPSHKRKAYIRKNGEGLY